MSNRMGVATNLETFLSAKTLFSPSAKGTSDQWFKYLAYAGLHSAQNSVHRLGLQSRD